MVSSFFCGGGPMRRGQAVACLLLGASAVLMSGPQAAAQQKSDPATDLATLHEVLAETLRLRSERLALEDPESPPHDVLRALEEAELARLEEELRQLRLEEADGRHRRLARREEEVQKGEVAWEAREARLAELHEQAIEGLPAEWRKALDLGDGDEVAESQGRGGRILVKQLAEWEALLKVAGRWHRGTWRVEDWELEVFLLGLSQGYGLTPDGKRAYHGARRGATWEWREVPGQLQAVRALKEAFGPEGPTRPLELEIQLFPDPA